MTQLKNIIGEFYHDVKNQKLRTFLTIFGIMWGTVAIVVLLAFGMGFKTQMSKSIHGIGNGVAMVFPGRTTKAFEGFGTGREIHIRERDVLMLGNEIKGIAMISPEYNQWQIPVRVGQNILNPNITGIHPNYTYIRNIIPQNGSRFINDLDMAQRRRVVFIGNKVKDYLFADRDAIGELIYLGQTPFTVIGVLTPKEQNSSYNSRDEDRVFIPATTFRAIYGHTYISNFVYKVADPRQAVQVRDQIREKFSQIYKFDPKDTDALGIWDTNEFDKFLTYFFLAFNIFLGLIGSFTLAVGGIGVANIMYIVVQERTREIGIKRSLGARQSTIMFQFFVETALIVGVGAVAGFLISLGILELLQFMPDNPFVGKPVFTPEVGVATGGVLALIGLISGLLPARRAARFKIVDCLRA